MDLGATICTPLKPNCLMCPWHSYCLSFQEGNIDKIPIKACKKVVPKSVIGIGLIFNDLGEVLIDQRLNEKSMGGMWEFPGGKKEDEEPFDKTEYVKELTSIFASLAQAVTMIIIANN